MFEKLEIVTLVALEEEMDGDVDFGFWEAVMPELALGPHRQIAVQAKFTKAYRKVLKANSEKVGKIKVAFQMRSDEDGVFCDDTFKMKRKSLMGFWEAPPKAPGPEGKDVVVSLRFTDPIAQSEERVEKTVRVFPENYGVVGSNILYPPVDEAALTAAEERWNVSLCDDYKAFLRRHNGLEFDWYRFGGWRTQKRGFFNALERATDPGDEEIIEINQIYRLGSGDHPLDQGECDFFHSSIFKWGVPVAEDPAGNIFIQVVDGKRRGEILMLDHEYYFGGMHTLVEWDKVDASDRAEFPFDHPDNATADQVWNTLIKWHHTPVVAKGFDAFIADCEKRALAEMERMDKRYINIPEKKKGLLGRFKSLFEKPETGDADDWQGMRLYGKAEVASGFPNGVKVPNLLAGFLSWLEDKPFGSVGTFEPGSGTITDLLANADPADFGPFATLADGSIVALWLKDQPKASKAPVVLLDSEGQGFTLALTFSLFLGRISANAFDEETHEVAFLPLRETEDGEDTDVPDLTGDLLGWHSEQGIKWKESMALAGSIAKGFDDGEFAAWVKRQIGKR